MKHAMLIVICAALVCCTTVQHSNPDAIKLKNNESPSVQQVQQLLPDTLPPVALKDLQQYKPELVEIHDKPKPASFYGPHYAKHMRIELEGDGYLQVYRKDEGLKETPSGSYAGLSYRDSSDLLVFSDGTEFKLPDAEHFSSSNGRYLVARETHWETEATHFHVYDISQKTLTKLSTIQYDWMYASGELFGSVLSTDDEAEGYGTSINLYDVETGLLLNAYSPYPGSGYSGGSIGWNGTTFLLIFEKNASPGDWKLAVINNSGVVEKEREIFMGATKHPTGMDVIGHFEGYSLALTYGLPQKLRAFDRELNLKWEVETLLPHHQTEIDPGRYVYLVKNEKIECIDLISGSLNWTFVYTNDDENYIDSSKFFNKRSHERKVISIRSNPVDGLLLVLTAITHRGNWENEGILRAPELLIIDDSGSVRKKIDVGPELKDASIVLKNDRVLLLTDENVYEVNY